MRRTLYVNINKFAIIVGKSNLSRFSTIVRDDSAREKIINECLTIRQTLQPINDRIGGPLEKESEKNTILPFVFLLGNHSSGKSSFVNYIFQRKVQTAGVAPTDDSFTIIVPGPSDVDRDGPAFVGDPDMGFSGLKAFGPNLIHHTQLKIRSGTAVEDFAIVDTPGMIDSPIVRMGGESSSATDRGYDFENVCRWYAERADVILLFFDPDKPGTTGETLSILTNALTGLDHKLHIILNKADQFTKIHDFARAYGSLCWNLSKVIPRKDLPRIYTMCLPPSAINTSRVSSTTNLEDAPSFAQGLADLEATREEVVREVLNAPKRRLDNEISRLSDAATLLHLHTSVMNDVLDTLNADILKSRIIFASVASVSFLTGSGSLLTFFASDFVSNVVGMSVSLSGVYTSGILSISTIATVLTGVSMKSYLSKRSRKIYLEDLLGGRAFSKIYSKKIAEKDETLLTMWNRVKDHISANNRYPAPETSLIVLSNKTSASQRKKDLETIENTMESIIPGMRRKAAPNFNR